MFLGSVAITVPYSVILEQENDAQTVEEYILEAGGKSLLQLADCESSVNPLAFNPKDTDGKEKFGILQYDLDTWRWALKRYKLSGDIFDWKLQVKITQKLIKDGYAQKWPHCAS